MATKHAKVLDDQMFNLLMAKVALGANPLRDQAMILLSYKAGLRSQEIAGLEWTDVCDAKGLVRQDHFFVPSDITKNKTEANLPMHPHLSLILTQLRLSRPDDKHVVYAIRNRGAGKKMTPNAVRMWFRKLYEENGLEGCSSHSGRRTFGTRLARRANLHGCSIVDVQKLLRHAHLSTTERYVEPSEHVGRLVASI